MTTTINLFRYASDVQHFEAGTAIFREGEPGDLLYSVVEGEVAIWHGDELLAVLGSGELLGELALIDDGPRSATAVARTSCTLAPIDEQRFLYMVQHTPYFALRVMRVLAERLRQERSGADLTLLPYLLHRPSGTHDHRHREAVDRIVTEERTDEQ